VGKKSYRVGIVGLGRMGSTIDDEGHTQLPYSIAASCVASERLELAAGCDLLPERREAFQKRWGVGALYEDFRQMVEQERPDMVAVCTTATGLQKPGREAPNPAFRGDAHAELTTALADLQVPMLYVEKAMACSMRKADEVREAVLRNRIAYNTGVLRRFDNRYDPVRDAVLNGDIGQVQAAVHYGATNLMHGHIHSIDTLSWLLGDPAIKAVRGQLDPPDLAIEDGFLATDPNGTFELLFEGGVRGWSIPAGPWEFEIFGDRGASRSFNNGDGASLRRLPDGESGRLWTDVDLAPVTPRSTVVCCLEDLVDCFETCRPTRGHVDVTHHVTEACLAVAESHQRGGEWVELPLQNRDLYVFHI
jgi:predicted dehydrogenase